jgi:hypothetical protein
MINANVVFGYGHEDGRSYQTVGFHCPKELLMPLVLEFCSAFDCYVEQIIVEGN